MLTIERRTINERDLDYFLNDPNTNIVIEKAGLSEKETSDLLHNIAEKADWIIDSILSEQILQIENKRIRNRFRRFLISKKYNILIDYPRGGTEEYCIMYADDKCVFVQSPCVIRENEIIKKTSTIVLSPQGTVKMPEDVVYIYENTITVYGFTTRWGDKFGLVSRKGDVLLPCIFDSIDNNDYLPGVSFKGYRYSYVPIEHISSEEYLLKEADEGLIFVSGSGFFELMPFGKDEFIHRGAISFLSDDDDDFLLSEDEECKLMEDNNVSLINALSPECHRCSKEELFKYVEGKSIESK